MLLEHVQLRWHLCMLCLNHLKHLLNLKKRVKTLKDWHYLNFLKSKPFGAVYDYYCLKSNVPVGQDYIDEIMKYEKEVLSKR